MFFLTIMLLVAAAASTAASSDNGLPINRNESFSISLNRFPKEGIDRRLTEITISSAGSHLLKRTIYKNGTIHEQRVNFRVAEGELDRLYGIILANSFDQIKTRHIPLSDYRGGERLTLRINDQQVEKSNMGEDVVNWSSMPKFRRIIDEIDDIVMKKTKGVKI